MRAILISCLLFLTIALESTAQDAAKAQSFVCDIYGVPDCQGPPDSNTLVGDESACAALAPLGGSSMIQGFATCFNGPPSHSHLVNSAEDSTDNNVGDGICDTGGLNSDGNPECTLRAAMLEANFDAIIDTIGFAIAATDTNCSAGICTIMPDSALPSVTRNLVIDGETQPGATCGSGFASRDLRIVLDGSNAGSVSGLILLGGMTSGRINGLTINNFGAHGIDMIGADSVWISCNYIGTDETGMVDQGNAGNGINKSSGGLTRFVTIGTNGDGVDDTREGNLISGNQRGGIHFFGGVDDARISGNYIGLNAAASATLANASPGIFIFETERIVIGTDGDGTSDAQEANVIVGNSNGIFLEGKTGFRIAGNFIGTDTSGTKNFGNGGTGILILGNTTNSFIGFDGVGSQANERNVIAFNDNGVAIRSTSNGIAVLGNSVYSNFFLGIDLASNGVSANDSSDVDLGPNNLQNFPDLVSANLVEDTLAIFYRVDSDSAHSTYPLRIEFFKSDADQDEGERFLAADSLTVGDWSDCGSAPCLQLVSLVDVGGLAPGDHLVATATDSLGNTSEFSMPILVTGITLAVNSTADTTDANPGDGLCYTGGVNTAGDPECTLRAAIEEANAFAGTDTVSFAIPAGSDAGCNNGTGVCTIMPDSALPLISQTMVLDGESQPGATCGTDIASRNLKIVLDGMNAGAAVGLRTLAGTNGTIIRGLVIHSFESHGIMATRPNGDQIACNYIGTDVTGMFDLGNGGHGITTDVDAVGFVIGTDGDGVDDEREGNLISGNASSGINLYRTHGSTVAGNYIGWNADGSALIGNTAFGIIFFQASTTTVGTDGDGVSDDLEANVIVGNAHGVAFARSSTITVAGNYVGTDPTGLQDFGNTGIGVGDFNTPGAVNVVVGTNLDGNGDDAEGNTIAFNGSAGVSFPTSNAFNNAVRGNAIYSNGGLGIDLETSGVTPNDSADVDVGSNNLQNFPDLVSVTLGSLTVVYSVDSDTAHSAFPLRVEFFKADSDGEEGQQFLGFDMYTASEWHGCGTVPCADTVIFASGPLVPADSIVATTTDSLGNTSEFSPAIGIEFGGVALSVKAFLEGPYNSVANNMNTDLFDGAVLPLSQPFSDATFDGTVLDFDSVQTVGSHPDSTVDWLLVNLRTSTDSASTIAGATHAAVIFEGGSVVSPGDDSLRFAGVEDGPYYLVLRSRNHLDIMSSAAIVVSGGVGSWNFTTAATQAFGASAQKEVETGVWGMFAGDGTIDGQVTASDFNLWLVDTKAVATGYLLSDFNLDEQVTASDFNLWLVNTKAVATSKVP